MEVKGLRVPWEVFVAACREGHTNPTSLFHHSSFIDLAKTDVNGLGNALIGAAGWGHEKIVRMFLDNDNATGGAMPLWKIQWALYEAARGGYKEVVGMLLGHRVGFGYGGWLDGAMRIARREGPMGIYWMMLGSARNRKPY